MYRAPSAPLCHFINATEIIYDMCLQESTTVYLIGDLNVDLLNQLMRLARYLMYIVLKMLSKGRHVLKGV